MNIRQVLLCAGYCLSAGFSGLLAETVETRSTIVVKSDSRTGRLVRSVVVAPKVLGAGVSTPAVEPISAASQEFAAGSLTEMINAIAERNKVEPSLVHSVIKAESNYNPVALSPKGAQGLMQLIPSTARRFGVSNSFNVQQNVEGGVRYLKFLMDLYHDDYVKVIAAYNAGEGAVDKYHGIPPYSETINYVMRVGKNLKAARQYADQKAKAAAPVEQISGRSTTAVVYHPIAAVTAPDGKVYYKTQ